LIVDLHAHYPMQLRESSRTSPSTPDQSIGDVVRAAALAIANRLANFHKNKPVVTIDNLRAGGVNVALSVLYLPFNEIDFSKSYGAPPASDYFEDLIALIDAVEAKVAARPKQDAIIARNLAEVRSGLSQQKVVLIHAVEGGFHVGENAAAIRANVKMLRDRGVAYITPAHLFFRGVATNSPALPFMRDEAYDALFPQPAAGLTILGRALIEAMVANRILIDVTHMSERALDETVALLDQSDPGETVPIIATHSACRYDDADYNLSDKQIKQIAARKGVIGLIACKHWMEAGLFSPKNFAQAREIFEIHVQRILDVTGSDDVPAIGSDMDGFIKPPLPGFEKPQVYKVIEERMHARYGAATARKICADNALRALEFWG
jgi:microsomal dipeptidase-like Zn-dependent dipeptidase